MLFRNTITFLARYLYIYSSTSVARDKKPYIYQMAQHFLQPRKLHPQSYVSPLMYNLNTVELVQCRVHRPIKEQDIVQVDELCRSNNRIVLPDSSTENDIKAYCYVQRDIASRTIVRNSAFKSDADYHYVNIYCYSMAQPVTKLIVFSMRLKITPTLVVPTMLNMLWIHTDFPDLRVFQIDIKLSSGYVLTTVLARREQKGIVMPGG